MAAATAAGAAGAPDGPFNSPRRNQQWQQFSAATAANTGSSQPGSSGRMPTSLGATGSADVGRSNGSSCSPLANNPGGYSSEGSAFAAALANSDGNLQRDFWIQHSTQDVIYEKLPADIAERHVLLMDPVLSTGNSAYTAIEVRGLVGLVQSVHRHPAYLHGTVITCTPFAAALPAAVAAMMRRRQITTTLVHSDAE